MSTSAIPAPAPLLRRASDYRPQPLKWLWPGRIPIGSITLLAGDPGTGKSLFALDLAARVSTGALWPDELPPPPLAPSATTDSPHPPLPNACANPQSEIPNPQSPPAGSRLSTLDSRLPGSVLILSANDQFHDTILPRLAAAGADQSRVYVLDHLHNLRAEMDELHDTIDELPDLKLLILDPINFYVGPGDAHFQTVVRTVLQPLAELARERGFAILAITHFRKNDGNALQRAAGSMGFVATARAIWTLTTDPDDAARRYLLPLKNNLTAPLAPLSFRITSPNPQSKIQNPQSPSLAWDPAAACGLASPRTKRPTPRDEAQTFLTQALAAGPRPAGELFKEADARGLTRRTLQRAFHDLAGHTKKEGLRAGWWWALGDYPIDPLSDDPLTALDAGPPTYASDVAAQLSHDRINHELAAHLAEYQRRAVENGHSSRAVTPSQDPRRKPHTPPQSPLSPSHQLSPSNGPVDLRAPDSPLDKPRHPGVPPAPIPIPLSLRPPNPLSAFVKHVTRPDRQPPRRQSNDDHRNPDST